MAGRFDKLADIYAASRPTYPSEWFAKLASLTPRHALAWDAGTGNGQAALSFAGGRALRARRRHRRQRGPAGARHPAPAGPLRPHPGLHDGGRPRGPDRRRGLRRPGHGGHCCALFRHPPVLLRRRPRPPQARRGDRRVVLLGDPRLPLLRRRPAAVPCHGVAVLSDPAVRYVWEGYRNLPFPFEGVGVGAEGEPARLEMEKEASFEGMLGLFRSWSPVNVARARGVELLREEVVAELEAAWGGRELVRTVTFPAFMIAGKAKAAK